MAHIAQCRYCLKQIADKPWCPECRIAHLGDLLTRTQSLLDPKEEGDQTIKVNAFLARAILDEVFETPKKLAAHRRELEDKTRRQKAWEKARNEAIRLADEAFEKNNPEPFPPTC